MPVLLRYGLSFVTIVWVLPSGASNHAKVLSILKQTKYASYKETPAISPREWRRLKEDLSVGFYLWTSTQNHKLLLFSQTYVLSRKQHQAFCMGLHKHLPPAQGPKKGPLQTRSGWPKHPFSPASQESTPPITATVKHFMLQVFLFVLTAKVRRRVMECVQFKMMTKLFIGWSYQ